MGIRTLSAALSALALGILVAASPASGAVTIGQVVDGSASSCDGNADIFQTNVGSGNSNMVPATGTITSWSTFVTTPPAGQQWKMKMFRKVSDPSTYQVVGHSAPEPIDSGGPGFKTFPANIAVKPGDLLGIHTISDDSNCAELAPTAQFGALSPSDLADGASASFMLIPGAIINIQATFVPQNTFIGKPKVKRNKKNGSATVTINLPNPGTLSASGGGAKIAKAKTVVAGPNKLKVKAKGLKKRQLSQNGKVALSLSVIYTPTLGDPHQQKIKLKLLKS